MTATKTGAALATRAEGPEALIEQYRGDFALVLPSHVKPEQFIRLGQAFLRRADDTVKAVAKRNPNSFLSALLDCARYGLEPGETYHFVPFGTAIVGIRDYKGEIELMHRTGRVVNVVASVVRSNDEWMWAEGVTPRPVHRRAGTTGQPMRAGDWVKAERGELVMVYAYAELVGGATSKVIVLEEADVMRSKSISKTSSRSDSVWNTSPEDAWIKTAIHRLWKWVPKSAEFMGEMARGASAVIDVASTHALPLPVGDSPEYGDIGSDMGEPAPPADPDGVVVDAEILDDEPESDAANPDPMTQAQSKALHALMRKADIEGDERHTWASVELGRRITSMSQVSKDEAGRLIDALQNADAG